MVAIFKRRTWARKAESDAFWDGLSKSFWDGEMWACPDKLRRCAREIEAAIANPENAPDLPELIALRDLDTRLLAEMEAQLPWTDHEQYFAFTKHVREETLAVRSRFHSPIEIETLAVRARCLECGEPAHDDPTECMYHYENPDDL
jgi:hypothetical protein